MTRRIRRPHTGSYIRGELKRFLEEEAKSLGMELDSGEVRSFSNQLHALTQSSQVSNSWYFYVRGDSVLQEAKNQIRNSLLFLKDLEGTIAEDWYVYVSSSFSRPINLDISNCSYAVFAKKDNKVSYGVDSLIHRHTPGIRPLYKDKSKFQRLTLSQMKEASLLLRRGTNLTTAASFVFLFYEKKSNVLSAILSAVQKDADEQKKREKT